MNIPLRRWIALALVCTMSHLTIVTAAQAALVGTESARTSSRPSADARIRVEAFFARTDVADQLARLGLSTDEARARVATLSDDELSKVADRLDQMPAGGDALGTLVGAAVLLFIILLVTDILGLTKVFSFTRPIHR
ncbi:MAG: PA2779 family protein [Burkholderiales bacterium]